MANAVEQGLVLTGEFLALTAGREWTDRNGVVHRPFVARMLCGQYVESVEFDDEAAALAVIGGAEARQVVSIPVRARGSWEDESKRFGRVSYLGRR